jgi:hypothetical protein
MGTPKDIGPAIATLREFAEFAMLADVDRGVVAALFVKDIEANGVTATHAFAERWIREGCIAIALHQARVTRDAPAALPATVPTVYVLRYSHRHGDDYSAHDSQDGAKEAIAGIVRDSWEEINDDPRVSETPENMSDEDAVAVYFQYAEDESHEIVALPVQSRR